MIWTRYLDLPGAENGRLTWSHGPLEIFFGEDDATNRSAMAQQVYAMLMGWA